MEIILNELNQDENIIPEDKIEMRNINYESAPIIEVNSPLENINQNLESPLIETKNPLNKENIQNQKNKDLEDQITYKSFKNKNKSNKININQNNENYKQYVIKLSEAKKKSLDIFCLYENVKEKNVKN